MSLTTILPHPISRVIWRHRHYKNQPQLFAEHEDKARRLVQLLAKEKQSGRLQPAEMARQAVKNYHRLTTRVLPQEASDELLFTGPGDTYSSHCDFAEFAEACLSNMPEWQVVGPRDRLLHTSWTYFGYYFTQHRLATEAAPTIRREGRKQVKAKALRLERARVAKELERLLQGPQIKEAEARRRVAERDAQKGLEKELAQNAQHIDAEEVEEVVEDTFNPGLPGVM